MQIGPDVRLDLADPSLHSVWTERQNTCQFGAGLIVESKHPYTVSPPLDVVWPNVTSGRNGIGGTVWLALLFRMRVVLRGPVKPERNVGAKQSNPMSSKPKLGRLFSHILYSHLHCDWSAAK